MQERLGVDIAMMLDECPPWPVSEAEAAETTRRRRSLGGGVRPSPEQPPPTPSPIALSLSLSVQSPSPSASPSPSPSSSPAPSPSPSPSPLLRGVVGCPPLYLYVYLVKIQKYKTMMNQEEQECCICYETIGAQNNCTTPCGHSFCFECMMKSLGRNNTCPCCRAVLQEVEEDSDNDGDYEEESDDEYERDELDKLASPEIIAERMTKLGYTMTDILALYMDRIDRVNRRYTRDFTTKLVKKLRLS